MKGFNIVKRKSTIHFAERSKWIEYKDVPGYNNELSDNLLSLCSMPMNIDE